MRPRRRLAVALAGLGLALSAAVSAAPVDTLREFVRDVKTGHAQFTQTVTSPDGAKKKASSGSFDFARPNRFRFAYAKPFEQTIVADGEKVWIYDRDLKMYDKAKELYKAVMNHDTNTTRVQEAENRLHAQKAILSLLVEDRARL